MSRRAERARRAAAADGPGDPLDAIHVTVRFDAPAPHEHCGCYERETCDGRSFPCCVCAQRNPLFTTTEH